MIYISIIDICILVLGCHLIKKYLPQLPDTLIPITCVFMSLITAVIFKSFVEYDDIWLYFLHIGLTNGLSAVGLNQLYRQTRRYILVKKAQKRLAKIKNKK